MGKKQLVQHAIGMSVSLTQSNLLCKRTPLLYRFIDGAPVIQALSQAAGESDSQRWWGHHLTIVLADSQPAIEGNMMILLIIKVT